MSGLNNLNKRLEYWGGRQQSRMNEDKLRTLKKAMLYSYQGATAILKDKREFRCLINSNKLSNDIDDKIISIPFEDICLNKDRQGTTTEGIESIGMKPGDTFEWKENGTHWIVTLQYKTETAYFRAQIREAKEEVQIGDKRYWCYVRGPVEQTMIWSRTSLGAKTAGEYFNELNYTLIMYITKDENTEQFFHRFSKIKVAGKPWEVQAIDNISMEGIIEVALKETYQNSIEEMEMNKPTTPDLIYDSIYGDKVVRPYDIKEYKVDEYYVREDGKWEVCADPGSNKNVARIMQQTPTVAALEIITGRSGNFVLKYITSENEVELPIEIKPL